MKESFNAVPLVSIVIVNFNGSDLLRSSLKSVLSQMYRPIEVIVVDNASVDNSVAMLAERFPDVKVIRCEKNLGYAQGNNVGVRAANGEVILLLNNDAVVDGQMIVELVRTCTTTCAAAVTSKVITEGMPSEFYEMNGSVNYLGYNIMRQFADTTKVFYAGGTSLMFRKNIVGEPFLREYFLYHEDVYLSWRLRLQGLDIRMAPNSIVMHKGNATTKKEASSLITFYQERNRILNLLLLYETITLIKLAPFLMFDVLAKLGNAALSNSKSLPGTLKAYWWLATHSKWLRAQRAKEQAARKVSDEIVLRLMSADVFDESRAPKIVRSLNVCAQFYARLVGLPFLTPEHRIVKK